MKSNLKDFFGGIINLFVIFLPGFILLCFILFLFRADQETLTIDSIDNGNLGVWILIFTGSYILGHFISFFGSHLEDDLMIFRPEEDKLLPVRAYAGVILRSQYPQFAIPDHQIRRWGYIFLKNKEHPSLGEIESKDADRRFFRNLLMVLVPIIIGLCGFQLIKPASIKWWWIVIALVSVVPVYKRLKYLGKKFSQLIFESVVIANPLEFKKMPPTTELRWFLEESDFKLLKKLFKDDEYQESEQLEDYYLEGLKEHIGIKWRKGRLEFKTRIHKEVPLVLPNGIQGQTEKWVKESLPDPSFPKLEDKNERKKHWLRWVQLHKTRRKLKYQLLNGKLVPVANPNDTTTDSGCVVELTDFIAYSGKEPVQGWTFAIEAFGNPQEQSASLKLFLESCFQPGLREAVDKKKTSYGYPAWLAQKLNVKK